MPVEWHGDEVRAALRARLSRNLDAATTVLQGGVRLAINRGNADGTNPSKVGEPPKKVTARLFQSIATGRADTKDELVGQVGSNLIYARVHELGHTGTASGEVVDTKARPFLRPTLARLRDTLGKVLAR